MHTVTSLLRLCLGAALFAAPFVVATARAGDFVVIVSAKNPTTALRPDQVADIFLGQVARFPDGAEAFALDQGVGSPIRDEFYNKITAKSPPLVKAYWTKMIFTGRGQPPKEVPSGVAMRKMVADNPSLIGYIDRTLLDASVKAVLVVR